MCPGPDSDRGGRAGHKPRLSVPEEPAAPPSSLSGQTAGRSTCMLHGQTPGIPPGPATLPQHA